MKNPLDSILGTIIFGLILTVVLFFVAKNFLGEPKGDVTAADSATTAVIEKPNTKDAE